MSNHNDLNLALSIASCSEVCSSLADETHPCHTIVSWQADQFEPNIVDIVGSQLQRPEPWTGDLSSAKIVFLSSNPSFDPNENFPNWNREQWNDESISLFGAERFTISRSRNYGATDSEDGSIRDRTIDLQGKLSKEVSHWRWVRQFAAFTLGKSVSETSARTDYVMTELVHCKSTHEQGVLQSLSHCTDKWFETIMLNSPAKIIFVAGAKAAEAFVAKFGSEIPNDWGSWGNSRFGKGKGSWPRTKNQLHRFLESGQWTVESQMRNMCTIQIGGMPRLVIYIARPGGGGGINTPWNHPELIHNEILKIWQSQI